MVLVTGAAGFIGYHLTRALLDRNMRVVGVDNMNDYYDPKLKGERIDILNESNNFALHEIDVEDYESMEFIFRNYEFSNIVHLAARAGVRHSVKEPFQYMATNVIGTLNMLELMREYGKKQMTFASTSSVYGTNIVPFGEGDNIDPLSPYAASKASAEILANVYSFLHGMNITVLRLFTVYGEMGRPDMCYSKFVDGIQNDRLLTVHGDGSQLRDFTYVDDVVNGIIKSFVHDGYCAINLGTGNTTSISELIEKIEGLLGKKAKIEYDDFRREDMDITQADNQKALMELSWTPKYNIDQGLKKMIGGMK